MPTTPQTAYESAHRVLTGHFREKTGYSTFRPRGTADWLLIYTIRGSGRFGYAKPRASAAEGEITTARGDAVLIRPHTLHDYGVASAVANWELLWAHFHPRAEWTAWLDWPAAVKGYAGLARLTVAESAVRQRVEGALAKMNRLSISPQPLRVSLAMNALEEALLWCASQVPHANAPHRDPRIEQAEEYLCQHLRDDVRLDDLADAVGLSVSRLSHLFRRQTGVTPQRYYEVQRLERARQLLEMTAMPIKQIACEVGFDNPFYFTLRFKRHTGKSPREYRRKSNE